MAFLQPDILPAMAEAIHRQLRVARKGRIGREALAALVIPKDLSNGPAGEKMFGDTLRELCSISAVVEADGGDLALPDDVDEAREAAAMPHIVRQKAMVAELETDLWEKDALGSLVLTGAKDLVRALAWFLSLDVQLGPFDFEKTDPALTELQEQHTGERPILNPTRWRPFVRWARYLGFSSTMSLYSGGSSLPVVLPDPTQAILAYLPACLDGDDWTPISVMMAVLADRLPVLDGGTYRRSIHDKGAPKTESDCSPSLTLAFQRLSAAGIVELEVGGGDAPKVTFANGQGAFHAMRWLGGTA